MGQGRLLGGCAWLLGGLALLQTLYLRALPPPRPPLLPRRPPRPPPMTPPRGVLDTSGTFRVYRDILGPPPLWDPPELILATHGTPGRVAGTLGGAVGGAIWGGPLSVAVFGVPREGLEELVAILGGPCRGLRPRLRLHVVVGAAAPPPPPPLLVSPNSSPPTPGRCRGALRRLATTDPPSYTLGVPYPGNLLRNVAWEGAAGKNGPPPQKNGGPGPPKIGGRFVLLVDADVVPSRGLREGFLRLLREGGAGRGLGDPPAGGAAKILGEPPGRRGEELGGDPNILGAPGGLGDPKALGAPGVLGTPPPWRAPDGPGGLRVPHTLAPRHVPGVPSDPRVLNALEVPRRVGVADVPGVPNVPSALELPKGFHDPSVPKGFHDPGVPNALEDPNALEVPKGFHDPGVPNALEVPKGFHDPGVPNALEDPNALEVPKGFHDPGVPNALEDPNALEVPKGFHDPGVPNALEDPNALEVPKGFHDPGVPNALEDPNALEVPKGFHDPGVPNTLEFPNTLEDPNTLKDPNTLEDPKDPGATTASWDQVVFVLPAFEVRTGTRVPGTKAELLQLLGTGDARPFYGTLCPRCQAPTDYGRWWALPLAPHLRVAYEVPWRDPWEPFYVGPAHSVPPFDERFLQYGFNRISQACELHVAGFRFVVLDGAFVVHRGFKEAGGFHGGREAELGRNRQLFRRFRDALRQRYPRSPRRC